MWAMRANSYLTSLHLWATLQHIHNSSSSLDIAKLSRKWSVHRDNTQGCIQRILLSFTFAKINLVYFLFTPNNKHATTAGRRWHKRSHQSAAWPQLKAARRTLVRPKEFAVEKTKNPSKSGKFAYIILELSHLSAALSYPLIGATHSKKRLPAAFAFINHHCWPSASKLASQSALLAG